MTRWFVAVNLLGAIAYDFATSIAWIRPEERAREDFSLTVEPYLWGAVVLPFLVVFLAVNGTWLCLLWQASWRGGRWWLLVLVCWLAAMAIDFAHH